MTTSQAVEMSKVEGKKNSKSFFEKSWENPLKFLPYIKFIPWSKKKATTCVIQFVFLFIHPLSWGSRLDHLNRVTFSPSPLASQMGCQISCRHHLRSRWKKHPWQKIAWQKKILPFFMRETNSLHIQNRSSQKEISSSNVVCFREGKCSIYSTSKGTISKGKAGLPVPAFFRGELLVFVRYFPLAIASNLDSLLFQNLSKG